MFDVKSPLRGVTDRDRWAARGASFVAKVKATKVVWFPPEPVETGRKTAATATKTTKRTGRKTAAAAKKTTSGTAKKVASPLRRKKA